MAEKPKKQKTKNDNLLHIRLGNKTSEEVTKFATEVYGFDSVSEYVRYALDYIEQHKPVLGKDFTPESARG